MGYEHEHFPDTAYLLDDARFRVVLTLIVLVAWMTDRGQVAPHQMFILPAKKQTVRENPCYLTN